MLYQKGNAYRQTAANMGWDCKEIIGKFLKNQMNKIKDEHENVLEITRDDDNNMIICPKVELLIYAIDV